MLVRSSGGRAPMPLFPLGNAGECFHQRIATLRTVHGMLAIPPWLRMATQHHAWHPGLSVLTARSPVQFQDERHARHPAAALRLCTSVERLGWNSVDCGKKRSVKTLFDVSSANARSTLALPAASIPQPVMATLLHVQGDHHLLQRMHVERRRGL